MPKIHTYEKGRFAHPKKKAAIGKKKRGEAEAEALQQALFTYIKAQRRDLASLVELMGPASRPAG